MCFVVFCSVLWWFVVFSVTQFSVFSIKFVKFGFKLEENNEKYISGFFF